MPVRRPSVAAVLTCGFVLIGVCWGGFLGFGQIAGTRSRLDSLENLSLDWRFSLVGPRPAPRGVVIAAIDDEAIRVAGGYPLPRAVVARIVRSLNALNPQAIALDIAFLDAGPPEADAELAEALAASRAVIAAIGIFDGEGAHDEPQDAALALVPNPTRVLWPTAGIRAAARSGLVNVATDAAGIPRHIPMLYRSGDEVIPSFALAAAAAALNTEPVFGPDRLELAGRTVRTDLGYHLPIRYYGPGGSIRRFSAARILRGDLDPQDVRGQIVLLGATGVGAGDTFATPFDRIVPGVEIFATGISNLLAGDGLVRTPSMRRIDAAAAILLPVITVLLIAMRSAFKGLVLAGILLTSWLAFILLAFYQGYWLSAAVPMAAVAPVAIAFGAARLALERRSTGRLAAERAALTRFQSPLLVEHILKNPRFLETPVHQNIAVLFLDLSGFTGVTESLGPQWARELLAAFQTLIERDVAAQAGFVVSFLGDGAMILFGLPQPQPDDASRALLAVTRLQATVSGWLATLPPVARERLSARIGGHFGPAVVSRLGPAHHQHITATGDTVNVASRLLEVAKQRQLGIVVSEDLCAAADLPASLSDTAFLGLDVDIRGRAQSLRIRAWKELSVSPPPPTQ